MERCCWIVLSVLLVSMVILPCCSSQQTSSLGAANQTVEIFDTAFQPKAINISMWSGVAWINQGNITQTVTARDMTFDSGNLSSGQRFNHTFLQSGTFDYYSRTHPLVTGTVYVTSSNVATGNVPVGNVSNGNIASGNMTSTGTTVVVASPILVPNQPAVTIATANSTTIGSQGAMCTTQTPIIVQQQPVIVQPSQHEVVQLSPAHVIIEPSQPVLVQTRPVITTMASNTTTITPTRATSREIIGTTASTNQTPNNQTPFTVQQSVIVQEPQTVTVQPGQAQIIVEQPPTIIIRTQPLVYVVGPSGTNETVVGSAQSAIVVNATGQEVPGISTGTNATVATAITDDNSTMGSGQLSIDVRDQSVANNQVIIDRVYSIVPAWVVIYPNLQNTPDLSHYLGYAHVNNGINRDVVVPLTFTNGIGISTPVLWTVLQKDAGKVGVFEYPGPDIILSNGTTRVAAPFRVVDSDQAAPGESTIQATVA